MSLLAHTAPGPMAGTLFQPVRALWWLAQSEAKASVGIEYLDDIAYFCDGELIALEQDKNSLTSSSPLTNRSSDLWKTLSIWLEAIRDEEVQLSTTQFFLVTNKRVRQGWVKQLKDSDKSPKSLKALVKDLRGIGKNPSDSIAVYVKSVVGFSDEEIGALLEHIYVEDASTAAAGAELKRRTIARLMIPDEYPGDEIYRDLLGWIVDTAIRLLDAGEDAIIDRNAFSRCLLNVMDRYREKRFIEKAARLLTVSPEERNAERNRLFVMQLLLLDLDDNNDQVVDAIDDLIRRRKEITRIAKEGSITDLEIGAFEDRVQERWKVVFSRHARLLKRTPERAPEEVGIEILDECREHREILAGQLTQEYYLTRGTFHKLANEIESTGRPKVGWHPEFSELLKHSHEKLGV